MFTRFRKARLKAALLVCLILLVWAGGFFPWTSWVELRIQTIVAEKTGQPIHWRSAEIAGGQVLLEGVSWGKGPSFTAEKCVVPYSFRNIWRGHLEGTWLVEGVAVSGMEAAVARINLKGTYAIMPSRFFLQGDLKGDGSKASASFVFTHSFWGNQEAKLLVQDLLLLWYDGEIRAQNLELNPRKPFPLTVELALKNLSLKALLQQAVDRKTVASGTVSGRLPLTFQEGGAFIIHDSLLRADAAGDIQLPPDIIPGDNPQVALMRAALSNLHYDSLSIELKNEKQKKLSLLLRVQGRNPDLMQGRPVHLNVHLRGDVLGLAQQNLLLWTDPRKFLKQESHEKP